MKSRWYWIGGLILILILVKFYNPETTGQDCNNILDAENKSKCFTLLAVEEKNLSLCNNLFEGDEMEGQRKSFCYAFYASYYNDFSVCQDLNEEDNCYTHLALLKNDPNICNQIIKEDKVTIEDEAVEDLTKSYCVYVYALSKSEPSACEVLHDTSKKYCYNALQG